MNNVGRPHGPDSLVEKHGKKKRGIVIYDLLYEIYNRLADLSRVIVSILLSLSLFFFPFLFLVSVRFFGIASFRKRGKKTGGWKAYALPWKLEEWGIVAEESLIKELIF